MGGADAETAVVILCVCVLAWWVGGCPVTSQASPVDICVIRMCFKRETQNLGPVSECVLIVSVSLECERERGGDCGECIVRQRVCVKCLACVVCVGVCRVRLLM